MRLATIVADGRPLVAVVRGSRVLPLPAAVDGFGSMRAIATRGAEALARIGEWDAAQPADAGLRLDDVALGPAVTDPGAIYTIGLNYREPGRPDEDRPRRPLVYGKLPASVAGDGASLTWDRTITPNVDAECELGVVIGSPAFDVAPAEALRHVFGYTVINDISSRDPWLDGDQWLLGKSMPGFCPVGPLVVTADELDPSDIRLGCTINGVAIQDGRTSQMRFSIPEVIAYVSRHVRLEAGDLIATGTPARLGGPMGPERHLQTGDSVTVWIEHIGELTTTVA